MSFAPGTGATTTDNTPSASVDVTLPSARGLGDLICVAVGFDTTNATSAVVTDNLGNIYARQTNASAKAVSDGEQLDTFECIVTHAGTPTVTTQFNPTPGTTTASATVIVDPFTGSDAGSAIDGTGAAQVQAGPTTATDAVTSGDFATATDNDLIFTASLDSATGGDPGAAGTGFTLLTTGAFVIVKTAWKIQTTHSATTSGRWTAVANNTHITAAFAVTPAGSGGSNNTQTPGGNGLTASLGTPAIQSNAITKTPTGFGLTASLGTAGVLNGATITPTGYGLTATLGTFTTQADTTLTGIAGYQVTATLGTPTTSTSGNVSLTPTGYGLTASEGTPALQASSTLTPAGTALVASLGTPALSLSGNKTVLVGGFLVTTQQGAPTNIGRTRSILSGLMMGPAFHV